MSPFSTFVRQSLKNLTRTGSALPTSGSAARTITTLVGPTSSQPRRILEVGAGTGAITQFLAKLLGPGDQLIVCEIDPVYLDLLQRRFGHQPQVTVAATSVFELSVAHPFDQVVSTLPFGSLSAQQVKATFDFYRGLLTQKGTLIFAEFAFVRHLRCHLYRLSQRRQDFRRASAELDRHIQAYAISKRRVWTNLPPLEIHQLTFCQ